MSTDIEKYIADGMAKVREAIVKAPFHEEMVAGIEAMFRHMLTPPTEAVVEEPAKEPAKELAKEPAKSADTKKT